MSALGGIYKYDGGVIDKRLLIALGRSLATMGPDAGGEYESRSLGMAYRAFWTNRESSREVQPLVSPTGRVLCWDGRLDNREEIIPQTRPLLGEGHTDADIVIAAYTRWGIEFLPKLIGDFALALWDPESANLLLARDPVGTRTLYYSANDSCLIWSSNIEGVLNAAKTPLSVDQEYIAGYLTYEAEPWLTPYRSVYAVQPGHVVAVGQHGAPKETRFWRFESKAEVRYRDDEQYEQHFRQLFSEAVRCRLRASGPVWSELSGGLDSSSIVCIADELIATGRAKTPKLETVSYVYDKSSSCNELDFILCVEDRRRQAGHHIRESTHPLLADCSDYPEMSSPNPTLFCDRYNQAVRKAMSGDGSRVLLSGQGGDQVLCSNPDPTPELSDLLNEFRLLQLYRRLQIWSRASRKPYSILLLHSAAAMLPGRWSRVLKQPFVPQIPNWINIQFASRFSLRERMAGSSDVFGFRRPSDRDQAAGFLNVVRSIAGGYRREVKYVDVTYPYLHRPLVEFLQAIPYEQRVRPYQSRSLMRRALRDVLPETIANRTSKGSPQEAIYRAFAGQWCQLQSLFADARVCAYGFMDREPLLMALERARHGCEPKTSALIRSIYLELWLRALEGRAQLYNSETS
jgi:asparagine synthase (glutamine-hydrolysing)